MFNLFKKKPESEPEEELASIRYYIGGDSQPMIDVNIKDYDDDSMLALAELLKIINRDSCIVETSEIIKNFFISDNQEDKLLTVFMLIAEELNKKYNNNKDSSSKPYIKPSEMI